MQNLKVITFLFLKLDIYTSFSYLLSLRFFSSTCSSFAVMLGYRKALLYKKGKLDFNSLLDLGRSPQVIEKFVEIVFNCIPESIVPSCSSN